MDCYRIGAPRVLLGQQLPSEEKDIVKAFPEIGGHERDAIKWLLRFQLAKLGTNVSWTFNLFDFKTGKKADALAASPFNRYLSEIEKDKSYNRSYRQHYWINVGRQSVSVQDPKTFALTVSNAMISGQLSFIQTPN